MEAVFSGQDYKGDPCILKIDRWIKENYDNVRKLVTTKDWDHVAIISGLPRTGKSNLAFNLAKMCDPNFNIKNIAFDDEEFIDLTNHLPKFSSVVLDESFSSFNARISNSKPFLRIMNHLQVIGSRNLFIFLNLPNFYDLNKTIAVFRSSFLFFVFADEEGERGKVGFFDRDKKRQLYVKGAKHLDYACVDPDFIASFNKQKVIDEVEYEKVKREHLEEIEQKKEKINKHQDVLSRYVNYLYKEMKTNVDKIAKIGDISIRTIYRILKIKEK